MDFVNRQGLDQRRKLSVLCRNQVVTPVSSKSTAGVSGTNDQTMDPQLAFKCT
jgi:hypothetical protein